MSIKRIELLLLVAVLGAGAAFGTGEAESGVSGADRLSSIGFRESGMPIVEETVTVEAMISRAPYIGTPFDEQTLIAQLQADSNVDIVFEEIASDQLQERTNLMFASREFPDVTFNIGASDTNIFDAARGGDVYALDDLIVDYAPHWQVAFDERPVIRDAIAMPDGKVYTLPYYREILNDYGIRDQTAINVDWLEKVGMEMPTDTEELYEVLGAFRDGIEDGTLPENGVPWYFLWHSWVGGEWEVYNMFGLWMKGQGSGAERYLSVNDGTVEFGAIDPKLMDAANWMHKLYTEELIPEEVFTDPWSDYINKTRSTTPITGMWGSYFIVDSVDEYYDVLPVIEGPTGVKRYRSQPVRLQKNMFAIFTDFEYPEVMMRFIDYWAQDDFSLEASYGGPMIQESADGTKTVVGTGEDWYAHGPHNFFPSYISARASDPVNWTGDQGNRDLAIKEHYADYVWPQDRHYAYVTYTEQEQEELSILSTEIGDFVEATIAEWVVNGVTQSDFDLYLGQLQRVGLDDLMAIYQQAYDRFSGN